MQNILSSHNNVPVTIINDMAMYANEKGEAIEYSTFGFASIRSATLLIEKNVCGKAVTVEGKHYVQIMPAEEYIK